MIKGIVTFICIILFLGCFDDQNETSIRWKISQVVGHDFLENRHYSTVGIYFILEGIDTTSNDKYILSFDQNKENLILKDTPFSEKNITVLKVYLRDIDKLLGEIIVDSTQFKAVLNDRLESSKILIESTKKSIPKSNNYQLKYGFKIKRIL
jgi:hypothetical protein